jgi:hypothetical protein
MIITIIIIAIVIVIVIVVIVVIVVIIIIWLVDLTMLKNISEWEGFSHILWNIKNV